jgi:hypothetical protein
LVTVYLMVVAVTYLPLLLAAKLGSVPLWPLWEGSSAVPRTFFEDWGVGYAFLVSLPSLVILLVSDEYVLRTSLDQVQGDGVIVLDEWEAKSLMSKWTPYFQRWNLIAQFAGTAFGIDLGIFTLLAFANNPIRSWIAPNGQFHLAGYVYVYLYCISLLYTLVIFYVTRCIVLSFFLRALVAAARPLRVLPLHPDKCGGLRPVGQLGLRNQYTLTVLGINIVLLLVTWWHTAIGNVVIVGSMAYLILGPVIFMAPLLPFRAGMQDAKKDWTHEVARAVRVEMKRLREQIRKNKITKPDEESIERLRKVGAAIVELPIWPFDPSTLRKFAAAYIMPVALPLLSKAASALLNLK